MNNPVAMPAPYGYVEDEAAEFFRKARVTAKLADLSEGMEDCGDSLSRQVGGNHYKVASIQPWDVMAAYGLDPWSANVLKYLLRFPYKAGRQDLEKAQHYIEYLITHYDEVNDMYYNKQKEDMPLLLHEIKERLIALDEITLLELLNISSEDIVEMFSDRIEDNADKLEKEVK